MFEKFYRIFGYIFQEVNIVSGLTGIVYRIVGHSLM